MAIIGQEIEGYAINQINARQVLHGSGNTSNRSTDQISVLNANSSWISLASGVSISGAKLTELGLSTSLKDMGLAQANVLFSGTSKSSTQGLNQKEGFLQNHRDSSYTYGDYGYSPMPGITSVDVKTLNRGSLKKATVKIKINNKQQFDIIDVLYLRLGYTVLLEWGNSLFTSNGHDKILVEGTLLENLFFNSAFNGNRSYRDILTPIAQQRFRYNGNYDALLGKVSNFNWSFNPDGSYDAEITIISLGDVIESLKLNISTNKQLNAFILKVSGELTNDTTIPRPNSGAPKDYPFLGGSLLSQEAIDKTNAVAVANGGFVDKGEAYTVEFLKDVLIGLGITNPNPFQIQMMRSWRQHEGAKATYNPFNTTKNSATATYYATNEAGVKNYSTRAEGLRATIDTLNLEAYVNVISSIKKITNDEGISNTMAAINASPWGSKFIPPKASSWKTLNNYLWGYGSVTP